MQKRKRTYFFNDLGAQLLVLYLIIIIPALGTLLGFDYLAGQRIQVDVRANDLSLAQAIALETDLSISRSLQAVEGLSLYPDVVRADKGGMEDIFSLVIKTRPDVNLVYRLDQEGTMLYHYPEGPGSTVGKDFSHRDYYQSALREQNPLVSKGRISPTTNQAVATAVMPLWDGRNFLGVVATNIKLESLSKTIQDIYGSRRPEEDFEIVIIDSNAQVIAHPESAYLLQPADAILPDIYDPLLAGKSGTRIEVDTSGEERLYTYAPIKSAGWGVIVSRPTATAFATQQAIHRVTIIVVATFIALGILVWAILSRRVIMPIERLASISRAIGSNIGVSDVERRRVNQLSRRPDQIGYLIRSVLRMESAIAMRIDEQETLLETSKAVVSSLDLEIVLDRILEQVQKLFNVQMCAIVALDEDHNTFRIRASRGLSKKYAAQLAIQPSNPNSITMRALRSQEPIQISNTETDTTFKAQRPRAKAEGYRSLLAVPLNTQHAPQAALIVFRPDPHVFTHNETQLLVNFANHVTMAIENATLYTRSDTRLQQQTRRIEALVYSMSDGLILSNLSGKVIYTNPRIRELADLNPEDMQNATVDSLINGILSRTNMPQVIRQRIDNAMLGGQKQGVEIPLFIHNRRVDLRLQIFDVTDHSNKPIGRGLILRDVTIDREIDRMKSSLISTVSHELRTPLAAIKGYATTLLADDVEWDPESQREFLSIISEETDRLSALVNSLLDLSRMESGNLNLSRVECAIDTVIERASQRAHLAEGNTLAIALAPNLPPLYADPPRLETVIRNLIENAVKYAGEDAKIEVSVSEENQKIVFRVKDNGPGIPKSERTRIFESFYRVDTSLTRLASGAGLGLAICKGLIQAHGGEIWAEDVEEGTSIAFSLPVKPSEE